MMAKLVENDAQQLSTAMIGRPGCHYQLVLPPGLGEIACTMRVEAGLEYQVVVRRLWLTRHVLLHGTAEETAGGRG